MCTRHRYKILKILSTTFPSSWMNIVTAEVLRPQAFIAAREHQFSDSSSLRRGRYLTLCTYQEIISHEIVYFDTVFLRRSGAFLSMFTLSHSTTFLARASPSPPYYYFSTIKDLSDFLCQTLNNPRSIQKMTEKMTLTWGFPGKCPRDEAELSRFYLDTYQDTEIC